MQKYVPYFNGGRVLAFGASAVLSFPKEDNAVPMYLQPTLGGSDELRGFAPYRFKDYHSVNLTAEHRWHAFSLLDMALFADAGKVVPLKRDVDVSHLHYSGGIGFRWRIRSAIVSRIDFAVSSEGLPDGSGPSATSSIRSSDAMSRIPILCLAIAVFAGTIAGGAGAPVLPGRSACRRNPDRCRSASRSGAR